MYKYLLYQWIPFQEFYGKSILSQHYKKVQHIYGKGFSSSCRLCEYGKNESDGESTECEKFGFIGGADWICDSYVDGLAPLIDTFIDAQKG